jgi:aldehyde:ferredoxin oxidoreductase
VVLLSYLPPGWQAGISRHFTARIIEKESTIMPEYGYAGEILMIDLSRGNISRLPTANYAERFLGGRGIAAKIYWDMVSPDTGAFDAENCIIIITGPLAGFTRFSGCRWQIYSKSPDTGRDSFSYANLGGSWGAWLKYAGYDGIAITGRAAKPAYIYLDNGKVEIRDAAHLWGKTTLETEEALKAELGDSVKTLEIGPAAENMVYFATVLASDLSSGSSGLGSVFGSKKLKGIAVKADEKKRPLAADPARLQLLARRVYEQKERNWEPYPEFEKLGRFTACHGCISGCHRRVYQAEGSRTFRSFCQAAIAYVDPALKYSDKGTEVYRAAARLNDKYGLDSIVMQPLVEWLSHCYAAGILTEEETGLPLSKIGSLEFIETLVRKISFREGFGDVLARGTVKAAGTVGRDSEQFISRAGIATLRSEKGDYDPRYMLTTALLYATEPRRPIQMLHALARPMMRWMNWLEGADNAFLSTEILRDIAEKYWGSAAAADFSTYDGKALASKTIQDYSYVKESLIICDLVWPIHEVHAPDKNMRNCTLESQMVAATTGREMDEDSLLEIGERNVNLQRAILLREGWPGREGDKLMDYLFQEPLEGIYFSPEAPAPGPDGKIISRNGEVVDRTKFEQLKDEYYRLRGWDIATGLPTVARLEQLDLGDIATVLKKSGLAI